MASPFDTDPFGLGDSPFRRRRRSAMPVMEGSEQEVNSALEGLGSRVLTGLEAVGNVLDTPGAFVRNSLAGRNPLPGLLDTSQRITGRDLLTHWGVAPKNQPGLFNSVGDTLWDAAGLATEVFTDPLTAVTGPLGTFTKSGRAAQVARSAARDAKLADLAGEVGAGLKAADLGKVRSAVDKMVNTTMDEVSIFDQFRSGERGVIGLQTPFGLNKLWNAATGGDFDGYFGALQMPGQHAVADIMEDVVYGQPLFGTAAKVAKTSKGGKALSWEDHWTSKLNPVPRLRSLFDSRVMDLLDGTHQKVAERVHAIIEPLVAEYRTLGHRLAEETDSLKGVYDSILEAIPVKDRTPFDDFMRLGVESIQLGSMGRVQQVSEMLLKAGAIDGPKMNDAAVLFSNAMDQFRSMDDAMMDMFKYLGVNVSELEDAFARHLSRNPRYSGLNKLDRKVFPTKFQFSLARSPVLKDIPGATATVQKISRDPLVTGIGKNGQFFMGQKDAVVKELKAALETYTELMSTGKISQEFGSQTLKGLVSDIQMLEGVEKWTPAWAAEYLGQKYALSPEKAIQVAHYFKSLPKKMLETGFYTADTVSDMTEYLASSAKTVAATMAFRRMALEMVEHNSGEVELSRVWNSMGLRPEGLKTLTAEIAAKYPKRFPTPDSVKPDQIMMPYSMLKLGNRVMKAHVFPESVKGLTDAFDRTTSWLKAHITVPFPGFHTRNLLSGQWANWATDQFSMKGLRQAMRIASGKENADDLLKEMHAHGLLGDQHIFRTADNIGHNPTARLSDLLPKTPGQLDFWVNPEGTAFRNLTGRGEAGLRGVVPEFLAQVGPEGVSGSAKLLGAKSRNPLIYAGDNGHRFVEFVNRASPYIHLRSRGFGPMEAARRVKLAQFDYADLTGFEKQWMKRLMPFYAFARKNLPHQVSELLKYPGGKAAQTIRTLNYGTRESEGYIPEWVQAGNSIRVRNLPNGDVRFLSMTDITPLGEAFERIYPGDLSRTLMAHGAQLHPVLRYPAEQMTGRQLFTGRELEDLYLSPTASRRTNQLIFASPASRYVTTARTLADPRKGVFQKAVNTLVGAARFADADVDKALQLESKELLESIFRKTNHFHVFERPYVTEEDLDKLSEKDKERLSLYNALIKIIQSKKKEGSF